MGDLHEMVDALVSRDDEIKRLKRDLAIYEARLHQTEMDLSSMRGSCKAIGEDLRKARARNATFTRALSWVARELDLSLVGKPDWLLSTLRGVIEREQKAKQKGARV